MQIGLSVNLAQVTFECDRPASEQAFDRRHVTVEQPGKIELCSGDINTGLQRTFEYDLETVFAHVRSILVASD
ncbi:hypothetical protein D3C81_1939130 [compost metagenome]